MNLYRVYVLKNPEGKFYIGIIIRQLPDRGFKSRPVTNVL
jgi:hypothetical protein